MDVSFKTSSNVIVSSIISIPLISFPPRIAAMPAPIPPAAPPPSNCKISFPVTSYIFSAKCLNPSSNLETSSGSTPFCGPNIAVAPFAPHKTVLTSHINKISVSFIRWSSSDKSIFLIQCKVFPTGINSSPLSFKNLTPNAVSAPAPPSFVALPPSPNMIFFTPP